MSLSRGGDYRDSKPIRSFPEPEKTSAWDKEQFVPKDIPVRMVDFEGETLAKKKAALRAAVSAPGALGLHALLDAKRIKYGIPDGVFRAQAIFDRVFVYPIEPFDSPDGEQKIAGTDFFKPTATIKRDLSEGYRGVLISAGLTAMDRLMSHGILIGDTVMTNKNVPFARRCQQIEGFGDVFVLVMRDGDLAGSEDLAERMKTKETVITDTGTDSYCHQLVGKKKASCFVNDTY